MITALTAQNTTGVTGIHQVPAEFVTAQIDAVFSDLEVGAVKIGMVADLAVIDAIAAGLDRWSPKHVVLDPVMVATSGDRLLAAEAVDALRTKLIPRASLITPNLPEAAALLDEQVAASESAIEAQGKRLLALGCRAVLIKGGHGQGAESTDYLVTAPAPSHCRRRASPPKTPTAPAARCRQSSRRRSRRATTWKPPCATRKNGSPPPSPPRIVSPSATATDRCIIFTSFISAVSARMR